jgi:hypothetical protein
MRIEYNGQILELPDGTPVVINNGTIQIGSVPEVRAAEEHITETIRQTRRVGVSFSPDPDPGPVPEEQQWPHAEAQTALELSQGRRFPECPRIEFSRAARREYEVLVPLVWQVLAEGGWHTPYTVCVRLGSPPKSSYQIEGRTATLKSQEYDRIAYLLTRLRQERHVTARPSGRSWHYAEPIWAATHFDMRALPKTGPSMNTGARIR